MHRKITNKEGLELIIELQHILLKNVMRFVTYLHNVKDKLCL